MGKNKVLKVATVKILKKIATNDMEILSNPSPNEANAKISKPNHARMADLQIGPR